MDDASPTELISALSWLRWLRVVSRRSSFRFRDPATSPAELMTALEVRFVLTGIVEITSEALALSIELIRTETGAVIWSNRFAGALSGILEIRAEIVKDAASVMEIHISYADALEEAARRAHIANDTDPRDPFSNDNMARVHWLQGDIDGLSDWLDRAMTINPNYAQGNYAMS